MLQYIVEMNKVSFKQNFNSFRGVWGLSDQSKNEWGHKTDYFNVVSGFKLEVHITI